MSKQAWDICRHAYLSVSSHLKADLQNNMYELSSRSPLFFY